MVNLNEIFDKVVEFDGKFYYYIKGPTEKVYSSTDNNPKGTIHIECDSDACVERWQDVMLIFSNPEIYIDKIDKYTKEHPSLYNALIAGDKKAKHTIYTIFRNDIISTVKDKLGNCSGIHRVEKIVKDDTKVKIIAPPPKPIHKKPTFVGGVSLVWIGIILDLIHKELPPNISIIVIGMVMGVLSVLEHRDLFKYFEQYWRE